MSHRRLVISLVTAALAGGVALAAAPAIAQDKGPEPTVYRFSLPGSVKSTTTKLSLPGDVVTKKLRGGEKLGELSLADMVGIITAKADKGHGVLGTITIKGQTREMRGLPVLMDDGTVKIRVAQARGSRALVVPRGGGAATGSAITCPPPSVPLLNTKTSTVQCVAP